jgi:hypothetical protein
LRYVTHTGSCLCGAVRYQISGDLKPIQLCHCMDCRKAQGTAFAANMPVAADKFRFLSGEDALRAYESSPGKERVFCGTCGSPILSRLTAKPDTVRVRVGTLDPPVRAPLAFHFHVKSKADWWQITDELKQYSGDRPS